MNRWNRIRIAGIAVCTFAIVGVFVFRAWKESREVIPVAQEQGITIETPIPTPDLMKRYRNVWIEKVKDEKLYFYTQGVNETMNLAKHSQKLEPKQVAGKIADLTCKDGQITEIALKPELLNDKVLAVKKEGIETEQYGLLPFTEDCQIYQKVEPVTDSVSVSQSAMTAILPGEKEAEFVVAKGSICAVLLGTRKEIPQIRVLLNTTGFQSHYHEAVEMIGEGGLVIRSANGETQELAPGEPLHLDQTHGWLEQGRIRVEEKLGGKIRVTTITRNGRHPAYRGAIEIRKEQTGLTLVNELDLEQYLYAVVPSEMPVSYNMEALKAQAVCARSYARRQMEQSSSLQSLGAHLEDSVSSQVYHNQDECAQSIQAVDETKDQVLCYKDEIAVTYYFSTSCGYTTGAKEVWMTKSKVPYLIGKPQSDSSRTSNLASEEEFRKFLDDKAKAYDNEYPWYRWQVTLTSEQLSANMEERLQRRYEVNPSLVLTKNNKGKYESKPIDRMGTIQKIMVEKRQTGGIVTSLILVGSRNTVRVLSEYNIRSILSPEGVAIKRGNGSEVTGQKMLPSAFLVINSSGNGKKLSFVLKGGGYGHGVGMSQNGANTLASQGKSYDKILLHYYPGTHIMYS